MPRIGCATNAGTPSARVSRLGRLPTRYGTYRARLVGGDIAAGGSRQVPAAVWVRCRMCSGDRPGRGLSLGPSEKAPGSRLLTSIQRKPASRVGNGQPLTRANPASLPTASVPGKKTAEIRSALCEGGAWVKCHVANVLATLENARPRCAEDDGRWMRPGDEGGFRNLAHAFPLGSRGSLAINDERTYTHVKRSGPKDACHGSRHPRQVEQGPSLGAERTVFCLGQQPTFAALTSREIRRRDTRHRQAPRLVRRGTWESAPTWGLVVAAADCACTSRRVLLRLHSGRGTLGVLVAAHPARLGASPRPLSPLCELALLEKQDVGAVVRGSIRWAESADPEGA
ncbi:hypothetical protein UVI_02051240 [Ustilaginoidea virens]|uniref:Uncharacterized protein n=1 Tax=Ustilaginoidea virens TaxID=1159556 RepID=A0A1B5KXW0_USTVR|nr:hypothetical protein UVI_02051240 [Ustilaginoidea virens]